MNKAARSLIGAAKDVDTLIVATPGRDYGRILLAEIYRTDRGLVVLETGWCAPMCSSHPDHFLSEPVESDGGDSWTTGNWRLWKLTRADGAHLNAVRDD